MKNKRKKKKQTRNIKHGMIDILKQQKKKEKER